MTEAQQRRFYFPAWNGCAVANQWFMARNRLVADLDAQREEYAHWPDLARELHSKVVTLAEQLAQREHRAVNADHLRHGCNLVATGKASSASLDNKQTNRVVNLFRLLTDPEDLDAVMNWLHPDAADRQSYIAWLKKQNHEAAIIAISVNAYGTRQWEDLPMEKLRWLCKQLKNRTTGLRDHGTTRRRYETDPAKVPF